MLNLNFMNKEVSQQAAVITDGLIRRDETAKLLVLILKQSGFVTVSTFGIESALQTFQAASPQKLPNATYIDDTPRGSEVAEVIRTNRESQASCQVFHITTLNPDPKNPITWADRTYLLPDGLRDLKQEAKNMAKNIST